MNGAKQLTKARKHWTWIPVFVLCLPLIVVIRAIAMIIIGINYLVNGNVLRMANRAEKIDGASVELEHGRTSLDIDCSRVSKEDVTSLLEHAAHIPHELSLSLEHATADLMPLVARLHGVESLDLSNSEIGDVDLLRLGQLHRLDTLHLENTRITDDGLRALGSLPQLYSLDISSTDVTDACLEHLQQYPNLESIWIRNTGITEAGTERFRKSVSREVEFHS